MTSSLGNPLPILSSNFLRLSLLSSLRTDGRDFTSYRRPAFSFRRVLNLATCEVQLGRSIAIAEALCSVSSPAPDRPLDGLLTIAVEISAAAGDEPSAARLQQNSSGGGGGGNSSSRNDPRAIAITRILERQLRDARAVDTETLCIEPGRKVWKVAVVVTILDASGGNLIDCCALAVAGALLHARRADVSLRDESLHDEMDEDNDNTTLSSTSIAEVEDITMSGIPSSSSSTSSLSNNATYRALQGSVRIHSYSSRAPLPLAMLHIPVCVSFALFSPALLQAALTSSSSSSSMSVTQQAQSPSSSSSSSSSSFNNSSSRSFSSEIAIVDPSLSESLDCDGEMTFCVNSHRELCGMHKAGGCPVDSSTLLECARIAVEEGARLVEMLKVELVIAESKLDGSQRRQSSSDQAFNTDDKDEKIIEEDDDDHDEDDDDNDNGKEEEEDNNELRDSGLFILPSKRKSDRSTTSTVKSRPVIKRSVAAVLDNVLLHHRS